MSRGGVISLLLSMGVVDGGVIVLGGNCHME